MVPRLSMLFLESRVKAAPAVFTEIPPPNWIVTFPALPFRACDVLTGLETIFVIVKSSANAGLATPASRAQISGLRFTVPLTDISFYLLFPNGGAPAVAKVPRAPAGGKPIKVEALCSILRAY